MKTIFSSLFAVMLCSIVPVAAQSEAESMPGYVRFVNALAAGQGNTQFTIDGEELFPDGYQFGARTGVLGIEAGSHTFEVSKQGVESGSTTVRLEAGKTTTLVAFGEKKEGEEDDGESPEWRARILRLSPDTPGDGYWLTVVSVSSQKNLTFSATSRGEGRERGGTLNRVNTVQQFDTAQVDLGDSRREVFVRLRDHENFGVVISLTGYGNYILVLYDNEDGEIEGKAFQSPEYSAEG